jgi:SAM-dependent methyltransferase
MKLIEGDMRAIPLNNVCDAIINLYTSFGFFSDADNLTVLSEVASALKPEGKFLLDYWNPYSVAQLDGTRNWWWINDELLALAEVEYDAASGVLYDYRTVINLRKNEETLIRESVLRSSLLRSSLNRIRFYFPTELEEKLEAAGLKILALYGDFDGRTFDLDSRRLIVIAQHL